MLGSVWRRYNPFSYSEELGRIDKYTLSYSWSLEILNLSTMSGSGEQPDLPEDVIGRITSTLINQELLGKEAILCSLVSKKFSRIFLRRPFLFFDHDVIHKDADLSCEDYGKRYKEELNYLLSTLRRYKSQNISLDAFTFRIDPSHVDRDTYKCIQLAFERDLRRLDVSLNENSQIPTQIARLESLEQLRLSACSLRALGTWRCNLKELALESVLMKEEVFEHILRDCPNIQDLKIRYCSWVYPTYSFRVSGPSLKRLSIQLNRQQTFELNAVPALETLSCSYGSFRDAMVDMKCSAHQNLRSLSLLFAIIYEDYFTNFGDKFPKLEELSLKHNRTLKKLGISTKSIKKIELLEFEELQEAHFDVPNIAVFKYESPNNGQKMMLPCLSFTDASFGWISRIRLVESNANVDAFWFLELNKFLAALKRSEVSVAVLFKGPAFFSVSRLMIEDSSSVPEALGVIKEFCIETAWPDCSLAHARVVLDGIFWICRPQLITFRHLGKNYVSTDTEDPPRFEHSVKYSCDEGPPTSNCDVFLELLRTHTKEEQFTTAFTVEY